MQLLGKDTLLIKMVPYSKDTFGMEQVWGSLEEHWTCSKRFFQVFWSILLSQHTLRAIRFKRNMYQGRVWRWWFQSRASCTGGRRATGSIVSSRISGQQHTRQQCYRKSSFQKTNLCLARNNERKVQFCQIQYLKNEVRVMRWKVISKLAMHWQCGNSDVTSPTRHHRRPNPFTSTCRCTAMTENLSSHLTSKLPLKTGSWR